MGSRLVKMILALAGAGLLAGLSAAVLGLVDAGLALDDELARLEHEAVALHRATNGTVQHGAPADSTARPRAAIRRALDSLGATTDRVIREKAPSYAQSVAPLLGAAIEIAPAAEPIDRAFAGYLDQTKQAEADTARTAAAIGLRVRLLDLSYEMLVQKIGEARIRVREAVGRALTAIYAITLVSIAIAAYVVGRSGQVESHPVPAVPPSRRR